MTPQTLKLSNIKYLAKQRHLKMTELSDRLEMTYVGLMKLIRENSTTVATLERIAKELQVSIELFFIEEDKIEYAKDFSLDAYIKLKEKCEKQKEEIEDLKNKIIRLADRL